jgi:signal transduction histidine kinase
MSDDLNERFYAIFREHPALLVSALYVLASLVGMFWSWAYLWQFGINVFNYAQVTDFLIASLKEPFTWVLVVMAILMVQADNAYSRRVERRAKTRWFGWYGSARYRFINNIAVIALVAVFIFVYAKLEADETKDGGGRVVDVTFEEGGEPRTATLLGTTGQFVFLYDPLTERVDIHPFENVHAISFQSD